MRWDELVSHQASRTRFGPLRRKEFKAKWTLFTRLSKTPNTSRRPRGTATKNSTQATGRGEWEPRGLPAENYNSKRYSTR